MVDAGDLRIPEHCSSGFESQHRTMRIFPYGKPFSVTGLRNWFRDLCNAAGLPHCSAHGIRKFEATHAAEAGVTEHQLMGMFGGAIPSKPLTYTRKARQQKQRWCPRSDSNQHFREET
jgi:hypothetical protein